MMSVADGTRCPVCGAEAHGLDYRVQDVPVRSMTIHADRETAMNVQRGSIDLAACIACGLVFNSSFDPATQLDTSDYEETQAFSATFQGYTADLARRLLERHVLQKGLVLEIGCGKAGFLATICHQSKVRAVGVDPTVDPLRVPVEMRERLLVIRDRYREGHAEWAEQADLVCCRHTLEHLIDPLEILGPLRRHLDERPGTPIFIDVPSGGHVLEIGGCWDVYYEHCMYYRDEAFVRMLERSGFRVLDVHREYEGQYLCVESTIGDHVRRSTPIEPPDIAPLARNRDRWADWFSSDARGEVVLWGSGSRAVGFLGAVDVEGGVAGVVDINPRRRGRWMPGFEHPILSPEELREHPPDSVVIMNPAYATEIRRELDRVGVSPKVHVVDRPPAVSG